MTLDEAILLADESNPNLIDRARKIEWLSRLDQWIWEQVISRHWPDKDTPKSWQAYTQETDPDTALLVHEPYGEMYVHYLIMQMQHINQETDKYNQSLMLYMSQRNQYTRDYQRRHRVRRRMDHLQF